MKASARYGVDIWGARSHAEALDLDQVATALEGSLGQVQVMDRHKGRVVFTGTVEEAREALSAMVSGVPYGRLSAGKKDPNG